MIIKNKEGLWLVDDYASTEDPTFHRIKKIIYKKKTKYQEVAIVETAVFGKALVIDGIPQSFEKDEFIYHEALVHPSMVLYKNPKKVLILGTGEGASLREVLKYRCVKEVVAVDIDKEAVEICKKFLKKFHQNSFYDERVNLVFCDALEFLKKTEEKFDVIIADLTDPYEKSQALRLYSERFFKAVKEKLSRKGVFVMQSQILSIVKHEQHLKNRKKIKKVFGKAYSYRTFVPSYSEPWSFIIASERNPLRLKKNEIKKRLKENKVKTKFYSAEIHFALFALPPALNFVK